RWKPGSRRSARGRARHDRRSRSGCPHPSSPSVHRGNAARQCCSLMVPDSGAHAMTVLEAAQHETRRGRRVVPIPYRQTAPIIDGWQHLRLDPEDLPRYFNGEPSNIGVLLGEPSGDTIDVDLDAPEPLRLAPQFLPPTRSRFGRDSKRSSHWEYVGE